MRVALAFLMTTAVVCVAQAQFDPANPYAITPGPLTRINPTAIDPYGVSGGAFPYIDQAGRLPVTAVADRIALESQVLQARAALGAANLEVERIRSEGEQIANRLQDVNGRLSKARSDRALTNRAATAAEKEEEDELTAEQQALIAQGEANKARLAAAAAVAAQAAAEEAAAVALAAAAARPRVIEHQPLILVKVRVVEVERNNGLAASSVLDYVSRSPVAPSLTSGLPLNNLPTPPANGFENLSGISRFGAPNLLSGLAGDTGAGLLVNLTSEHINYVARLLATELNADVITAPQVTTLHGQEVVFTAGAEIPFAVGENTIQSNTNSVEQFKYSHVGTRIEVTPHIVNWDVSGAVKDGTISGCGWEPENCTIDLDILVQLSEGEFDDATDLSFKNNVRNISNKVQVVNGHGVVMGGLISARDVEVLNKTPVLGDIPLVGFFFRSTAHERSKSETLVFVEAQVIPAYDRAEQDYGLGQVHLRDELNCTPLVRGMHNAGLQGAYLPQPSHHEKDYWKCYHRTRRHEGVHRIATQVRDATK